MTDNDFVFLKFKRGCHTIRIFTRFWRILKTVPCNSKLHRLSRVYPQPSAKGFSWKYIFRMTSCSIYKVKLPITTLFTIFFFFFFLEIVSASSLTVVQYNYTILNCVKLYEYNDKKGRKRRKQNHNTLQHRKVSNVCTKVRDPSILQ